MSGTTSSRGVNVPSSGIRPGPSARTQDTRSAAKAGRTRPAPPLGPTPCYGKHDLFDSTDQRDHQEAQALCLDCPVLAPCRTHVEKVLRESLPYGRPEGTWAGRGFAIGRRYVDPAQIAAEDARYSRFDALTAHREYQEGLRSEWINTGERVWQRARMRRRRNGEVA